jgi:segregation and condensation protein A
MTISQHEARDLAETTSSVPREAAGRVLDYLIFHRALLSEESEAPPLLDRYMALVRNLKEGVHVVITDPYQKATALLFELVMDEEFDPWEIDLVRFTQQYVGRVRGEGGVDFAVAGRLLYMAWSILYLQSRAVLEHREHPPEPGAIGGPELAPGEMSYLDEMQTPEAVDVTSTVLGSADELPITPMIRHPETRPVSLLELVNAFGQAEADARRAMRLKELRERLREEQRAPPEVLVHGDIPERDLQETWEIARTHPIGEPFEFVALWRRAQGRDRLVALFLASLFLARENVLDLRQERVGESPLLLVRTGDERPPVMEE